MNYSCLSRGQDEDGSTRITTLRLRPVAENSARIHIGYGNPRWELKTFTIPALGLRFVTEPQYSQ